MISGAIIAQNEEKYIKRVLTNIYDYVDEIIIVDGGSTDNTMKIARGIGPKVKIVERKFDFNFGKHKSFAMEQCKGDWVLFPDCDEWYNEPFLQSIEKLIEDANKAGASSILPMRHTIIENIFVGEENQPRLLRKDVRWVNDVHENIVPHEILFVDCPFCMFHEKTWNRQQFNNQLYANIINEKKLRPGDDEGQEWGKKVAIERDSDATIPFQWKDGWRKINSLEEVHHA